MLKLIVGLFEGDEEGCAETVDDPEDGGLEGSVDGSEEGPQVLGALFKLGLLAGNEEVCTKH